MAPPAADPECSVGGMPASMCAHCRKLDLPPATDGVAIIQTTTAQFSGICALVAEHRIAEGSVIGLAASATDHHETYGWACAGCTLAAAL